MNKVLVQYATEDGFPLMADVAHFIDEGMAYEVAVLLKALVAEKARVAIVRPIPNRRERKKKKQPKK